MFELISILQKERNNFLDKNPNIIKFKVDQDLLNEICTYQSMINELPSVVKDDIVANPYIVLKDSNNNVYFSVNWHVGLPTTFPPQLDFVLRHAILFLYRS